MQRISVVGNSGSGKTTVAAKLASALEVPHLELDSVFHQPGWQPLDSAAFRRIVRAHTDGPGWVVDGNYSAVQDIVWGRADTVIWLDPPRRRVMRQLILRSLRRVATRAELWNGNTESWRSLLRLDPQESVIRWAWTQHRSCRARYLDAQHDPAHAHLAFVMLRTPAQTAALVSRAAAQAASGQGSRQQPA